MKQDINQVSALQIYPAGLKYEKDDRIFRYGRNDPLRQARGLYPVYPMMDYGESHVPSAQANAGSKTISCVAVAAVTANEYAGGLLFPNVGAENREYRRIMSNTAAVAPGDVFVVTLQEALINTVLIGTVVTLYHSMWREVHCMRQEILDGVVTRWQQVSFIGLAPRGVPPGNWAWFQTWGPCIITLSGGTEGVAINERFMVFDTNGAVMKQSYAAADFYQYAGFVLPETTGGAMPGAFGNIFLQLAH